MGTQYRCKSEGRRQAVLQAKTLNGIDYLEVASGDQLTLAVHFLFPVSGQVDPLPPKISTLTRNNILIEGGVRIRNIQVLAVAAAANVLTVTVDTAGDFSTYTLRLVTSPTVLTLPPGFDPQLSAVDFSFKVGCPSDFDCQTGSNCPTPALETAEINYLAKDYATFRRLMLDRLSVTMPAWQERNPADLQITLVEALAYTADHLSHFQDAVATEAYLATARQRISVRRHCRLLNYALHDGSNARAWVQFDVGKGTPADGAKLPRGTPLLTRGSATTVQVPTASFDRALMEQPVVFETMHSLVLEQANNQLSFYTWNDQECCLPKGATRATLRPLAGNPAPELSAGSLLLFEEVVSPVSGRAIDADTSHKHIVRLKSVGAGLVDPLDGKPVYEIEWQEADALPFSLCLTAVVSGSDGSSVTLETSVVRGNVALADHGLTLTGQPLIPAAVPEEGRYRPRLERSDVTFAVPYQQDQAVQAPAAAAVIQDPHAALPVVALSDGKQTWTVRRDLLASDRFAPDFVVETERDGSAWLRFGDDKLGAAPAGLTTFVARYRVGNGRAGNVGAGAITRVVSDAAGITSVRNPLPAAGGADPEALEQARLFAPQSFRKQQRAVTAADYAEVAARHPDVQRATARFRWTGSWYTVFVTIDRTGGRDVEHDDAFKSDMRSYIGQFRLAGYDLEIVGPTYVPLDIKLHVCVDAGFFQADVKQRLLAAFSDTEDAAGHRGFFFPDNLTFHQPVYLSQIYEHAMSVPGVASVHADKFQRWGETAGPEISSGYIAIGPLEVARLANDPNFPENGKIEFELGGGL